MNILNDIFTNTLNNELKTITYNNESYNCFFRRNDSTTSKTYTTVYFPIDKYIPLGAMFTYGDDTFLVTKLVTTENDVYKKAQAIKVNSEFRVIYSKGDIVTYKAYMGELIDSLSTKGSSITVDSNIEFILELNEDTKRLIINKRFFCGFLGMAWVINEINYRNNLCYIYCERSPIISNDDTINYIADRWSYESDTTDKYKVTTTSLSYSIIKGETATIGAKLTKNDETIDSNLIEWTIKDSTICSIAGDTITALSVGTTTVTGSYKANESDTCTTATFTVEVTEKVETGHIAYVDKDKVDLVISETETDTVKVTFTMNGENYTDTYYKVTVADTSICSATMSTNSFPYTLTIKALAVGSTTIKVAHRKDILYDDGLPVQGATITVNVTKVETKGAEIIVANGSTTEPYVYKDGCDYYEVTAKEGNNKEINVYARLNNVTVNTPSWSSTYTKSGLTSNDLVEPYHPLSSCMQYWRFIFTPQATTDGYITFTFKEKVSGLSKTFKIRLRTVSS